MCNFYSSLADNDLNKCKGILIARFCFELDANSSPPLGGGDPRRGGTVSLARSRGDDGRDFTIVSVTINKIHTSNRLTNAFRTKFRQRELIMATFDTVRIRCFFDDNSFPRGEILMV